MIKPRHLLPAAIVSFLIALSASAQTSLTEIRDTVTNVDGSPFNGTVIITWNGFTGPSGGTTSPLSTSANIYNGALSVLLVPTTTGAAGTYYQAVYNSSDGTVTWTEDWQVPASSTPLTLSQVRISSTQTSGGTAPLGVQYATLPIPISAVTNLGSDLNSINQNITTLTTQYSTLTTTVNGLKATGTTVAFVDDETPSGTLNGSNVSFTLSQVPSPSTSLAIYRNGLLQANGTDYTLTNSSIAFVAGSIPKTGDILLAYYRITGTGSSFNFADAETPSGTINGTNLLFTLVATPNPSASLKLFKNGVLLQPSGDYTLSGSTITFANTTTTPQAGDVLVANYRH